MNVQHCFAHFGRIFLCLLRLTRDLETQKEVQHLCGESNQLLLSCRALYCRCRVRTNEADPAAFGGNMKLAVNSIRNLVSYLKLQQSWVNCHSLLSFCQSCSFSNGGIYQLFNCGKKD